MKRILSLISFVALLASCSADPRSINYGEDACHHCKMKLMDPKFGAELVTEKGKIYIFDDLNCMVDYLHSEEGQKQSFKHILVTDYLNPGLCWMPIMPFTSSQMNSKRPWQVKWWLFLTLIYLKIIKWKREEFISLGENWSPNSNS
ncbi:nitrous oxide reductase accessory protein NosL [Algoriphagus hitonicola]|uniref:nitrous oxide reductase accessory protein NosL n=1 Tax=Algoriphagus hitonicola TaxID=435880 RepID=UPI003607E2F1